MSLIASVEESRKEVKFHVTNELTVPQKCILKWEIINAEKFKQLEGKKEISLPPSSSLEVESVNVKEINKNRENWKKNIIFFRLLNNNGEVIYQNFQFFVSQKLFPLKDPKLSFRIIKLEEERAYEMKIKSEEIALYVHVESDKYEFMASDNYFSLNKNETCRITLKIRGDYVRKEFAFSLKVFSLYDLLNKNKI